MRRGRPSPVALSLRRVRMKRHALADRHGGLQRRSRRPVLEARDRSAQRHRAAGRCPARRFHIERRAGAPVRGEIVAMVVNDAILQLSGYRLPDLVQTVFAAQPIATIFADNRENVTLKTQTPPTEKGFGYGGGFLAGAGSTRVRANFLPMAYYGVLQTDAQGRAHAQFTMPDDLTTWRVMAVALDGDAAHFVTGDRTFISTQPLIANPLLPQFARPGRSFCARAFDREPNRRGRRARSRLEAHRRAGLCSGRSAGATRYRDRADGHAGVSLPGRRRHAGADAVRGFGHARLAARRVQRCLCDERSSRHRIGDRKRRQHGHAAIPMT